MAISFGISNGRIELSKLGTLRHRTSMAWIYVLASTGTQDIFYANDTGVDSQWVECCITDTEVLRLNNQNEGVSSSFVLPAAQWYHVAFVQYPLNWHLFLNGTLHLSLRITAAQNAINTWAIGGIPGAQFLLPWSGRLAAVKIWNRSLTPEQIRAEMLCYAPVSLEQLHGAWTLKDNVNPCGWIAGSTNASLIGAATSSANGPPISMYLKPRFDYKVAAISLQSPAEWFTEARSRYRRHGVVAF